MAKELTAIQKLITEFLARKTYQYKPTKITDYRGLFYLALPEDYDLQIQHNERNLPLYMQRVAQKAGRKEIASWNPKNGSLQQHLQELIALKYTDGDMNIPVFMVFSTLEQYEKDLENISFLKEDFLPTLKKLEEGATPTRAMQGIIETALYDSVKLFHRVRWDLENDPLHMIHRGTFDQDVSAFLKQLQNEIIKVTSIRQVIDFRKSAEMTL